MAKDRLNLIVVVLDSLRQDHVSFYNGGRNVFEEVPAAKTPKIDSFAEEGIAFTNAYPSGLPTIPQRTELMTGQFTLPYKPWSPLSANDLTAAAFLKRRGYNTALVSDTYHMFKPGYNLYSFMDLWDFIRGQEFDAHGLVPPRHRKLEDYSNENIRRDPAWVSLINKFLSNVDGFREDHDEDWFPFKVFSTAANALRELQNRSEPYFLWVDSFDPHEPWEHPHSYDEPYRKDPDKKPRIILPKGGEASSWATPEEVDDIRALYAGEVSFVDRCFGEFYTALEETGAMEDSLILLLADHGHPLADHGKFLKGGDRMYSELLKIPFILRVPEDIAREFDFKKRRVDELISIPDVLPTFLELLGFGEDAVPLAGRSFLPVLTSSSSGRPWVVMGYHEAPDRCVRDGHYSYISRPVGLPDELYDLIEDPRETRNLIDERPEEAKRLAKALKGVWARFPQGYVKGLQGKYELYRGREGLRFTPRICIVESYFGIGSRGRPKRRTTIRLA